MNLAVFDGLRRLVQILVDGPKTAGPHQATFESGKLPSGLYLARLTTEHGVTSQSLQVAK